MKVARVLLVVSCIVVVSVLSGCFVIRGTTEEWRIEETVLPQEGPGASDAKLCRWQNNKVELDNGNRIAIGFFPGVKELDNWNEQRDKKRGDIIAINLFFCFPTVYNLIFGTISESSRRRELSSLTLFGSYEWDVQSGENVLEKCDYEDIISMVGSRSVTGVIAYGVAYDGTRLYFSYPGNDVVRNNISVFGKVAVMHDHPMQRYRLFYPANNFKGQYAFKDFDLANDSMEMIQMRYYLRVKAAKLSAARLLSLNSFGEKAKSIMKALDDLLVALPKMDEYVLARLEKELEAIAEAERRAQREREMAALRRRQASEVWRNEDDLREFALKESPTIWRVVQQLRAEVKMRKESIAKLREDLRLFGKDPESDPDCQKLGNDVDALLDSLAGIFVNLENAYIAAKKYEASPSRKDYQDTMKRALEDGIQSAAMATEHYKAMMQKK